jgi:hypothetical protein
VSVVTGGIAAYHDASSGNILGAAFDLVGGLGGGVALGAGKYASWLADAAEESNGLFRSASDLGSGLYWSTEGLSLMQRAGLWAGVSGVAGTFSVVNGANALITSQLQAYLATAGPCA